MSRSSRSSMSRAAARLVLNGLVAIALLPPLVFAIPGFGIASRSADRDGQRIAWLMEREAVLESEAVSERTAGSTRALAVERALDLLSLPPMDTGTDWRAAVDSEGAAVVSSGRQPGATWPALAHHRAFTRPLTISIPPVTMQLAASTSESPAAVTANAEGSTTRVVSGIRVERSLRPVMLGTLVVALASIAVALSLWGLVFLRPVRDLRTAEGRLRNYARLDATTGLLNRDGLRARLQRALDRRGRRGDRERSWSTCGVVLVDLDRFRIVNASFGQAGGDRLLCEVATRLRSVIRPDDVLARTGADQFVVMVESVRGAQALTVMARNMLRAFDFPLVVEGRETMVSLSIGLAVTETDAASVDALLQRADAAMRIAKASGGGRARAWEEGMEMERSERLDLDLRLRRALLQREFHLLFQPIVDTADRRIVAVEALLRWHDPERGIVQPADFIPVLEQTGLVVPVGKWVLAEACRIGSSWIHSGHPNLVLSVNVSPRQFAEPDFVETVTASLDRSKLPAACLQIEVTEGLLLEPTPETLSKIDALAELGVGIAVDDFGMGYSSLAYLKRFRLHALKIDRMFVRDAPVSERDAAIVRAIIDLAHGLGLQATAEGVETEAQFDALKRMGCDSIQGWLIARAMAPKHMSARLLEQPTEGSARRAEAVEVTLPE